MVKVLLAGALFIFQGNFAEILNRTNIELLLFFMRNDKMYIKYFMRDEAYN